MPDHDADVAAVPWEVAIEEAWNGPCDHYHCGVWNEKVCRRRRIALALTAAGYAVVKLPGGAKVEHGASFGMCDLGGWHIYAIEASDA